MNITPKQFVDMLTTAEFDPRSYSGRGMFGARCVSVTVSRSGLLAVGAAVAMAAFGDVDVDDDADSYSDAAAEILEHVRELMNRAQWDNMGLDLVVYWPSMPWPMGGDDDEPTKA